MYKLRYLLIIMLGLAMMLSNACRAQVSGFVKTQDIQCASSTVSFASTSTGSIISLHWDLGNGNTSTLATPSAIYSAPGVYYITLAVIRPGMTDTVKDSVIVFDKPVVTFTSNHLSGCNPDSFRFTSAVIANAPGNVSYYWIFGDGATDTSANPRHIYTSAGVYSVSLQVTNGAGCSKPVTKTGYITIYPTPSVNFVGDTLSFCKAPVTVHLTGIINSGTSPFTYAWNFGDGTAGSGATISHIYGIGGQFNVQLTVTDLNSCSATILKNNYVRVNADTPVISGPSALCALDTAFFVNATPGGGSAHWDFGDGDTAFGQTAAHPYHAGTFLLTMTTTIGGCRKSARYTILSRALPTATIDQFPLVPCPAPSIVTFSATSANAVHYLWSWASGGTDSGQTVNKSYSSNVYNDVLTLYLKDSFGCGSSVVKQDIRVRDLCVLVLPSITPFLGSCSPFNLSLTVHLRTTNPDIGQNSCNEDYPYQAISWQWDLANGTTSTAANPSVTYTAYGDYIPNVQITTPNGCIADGSSIYHVDKPTPPGFFASPLIYCPGQPTIFVNTSSPAYQDTKYFWLIYGDTAITKLDSSSLIYTIKKAGIYTVKLVTDHNGCKDSVEEHQYITVHPPDANFSFLVACSPSNNVSFTNSSDSATSQVWYFGDGTTDTAKNPIHTYPGAGNYLCKLVAYNSNYGCTDTLIKQVIIDHPVFNLTSNFSNSCIDRPLYFFAVSNDSSRFEFSFLFEGSQTQFSPDAFTTYAFSTTGYHDVGVVIRDEKNCLDTVVNANFILISQPVVHIAPNPPVGCDSVLVTFSDSSTNIANVPTVSRKWSVFAGDTISSNQPSVTRILHSGTYPAYLMVTDSLGCVGVFYDSAFLSVYKPMASFSVSEDSSCRGTALLFSSTVRDTIPISFTWLFGDGSTDTGAQPFHSYASDGVYNSVMIVTDSVGCIDSASHAIYIQNPVAGFKMSDSFSICQSLTIQFTSTAIGADHYSWNFDDGGGPVSSPTPVNIFSPGVYHIYQVAYNANGCTDTARSVVQVLGYNGAFTYSPVIGCAPLLVHFSPPAGIARITWDFADGTTVITAGTDTFHTYLTPGKYGPPTVIFSDGASCMAASTGLDTIRVDKVTAGISTSVPCVGSPFTLTQAATAVYENPNQFLLDL